MVYSSIIQYEGLETLKIYLQFFGFKDIDFESDKFLSSQQITQLWGYIPQYAMYYGEMNNKERSRVLSEYNDPRNVDGNILRVVMMSKIA